MRFVTLACLLLAGACDSGLATPDGAVSDGALGDARDGSSMKDSASDGPGSTTDGAAGDGGTSFACGMQTCRTADQYCQATSFGAVRPDMNNAVGACKSDPAACQPNLTCACLLQDPGNQGCTCANSGGAFTVSCAQP